MKLAANGYADLYTLLAKGEVPIDYIKCPLSPNSRPEVERALTYRPVVLHCWGPPGYSATRPEIPEPALLTELSAVTGTPFLSVHLDYKPDLDGEKSQAEILVYVRHEVVKLKALCSKDVLLENVPYYPWHTAPCWATDPAFITEAIVSSDASFLIDTAHARVAAWHRGEDVKDYLAALPLVRAREIHVSGPRMSDEGLRDRHMALMAEDYELIDFVLERAPKVELITTEYAGRREKTLHYNEPDGPELLAEQLEMLNARYRTDDTMRAS
ncbi:MAG: DUF692 family protein [Armatimonas sp.]